MNISTPVAGQIVPKPPTLHWVIVLVLSIVTFGSFACLWMFRQARFARKIDPSNKAPLQIAAGFALALFSILLNLANTITVARGGESTNFGVTGIVIYFFTLFMLISAYLEIRKTLTSQSRTRKIYLTPSLIRVKLNCHPTLNKVLITGAGTGFGHEARNATTAAPYSPTA